MFEVLEFLSGLAIDVSCFKLPGDLFTEVCLVVRLDSLVAEGHPPGEGMIFQKHCCLVDPLVIRDSRGIEPEVHLE